MECIDITFDVFINYLVDSWWLDDLCWQCRHDRARHTDTDRNLNQSDAHERYIHIVLVNLTHSSVNSS